MAKPVDVSPTEHAMYPAAETSFTLRRSRRTLGMALGCFGLACVLAGAAGCLVLGAPHSSNGTLAIVACSAVAAAIALVGTGLLLALRERRQHIQELRRAGRIEHIQHELDLLGLTPKEMTIARLVLQHRGYDAIAHQLGVTPRTVQFHASNIYRKAYVTRRRDFERLMLADKTDGEAKRILSL